MKKCASFILALIMLVAAIPLSANATTTLIKIEDDFENGLNRSIWRYDASGAIVANKATDDDADNMAAYLPYRSSGEDTKNHRLRNNQQYLSIKDRAIIKFDFMVETASQVDEYFKLYGVDADGNAISTYYLLSYHNTKNFLYINGKANAKADLAYDTWCSIVADVNLKDGKYSIYVNGSPLTNNDGSTVFNLSYASDYTGDGFCEGSTLQEIEILARRQGGALWVDNISVSPRFFADESSDYGFFASDGKQTEALDPNDTVYKATIVNNGLTDENLVLYLAGYDAYENILESVSVKKYSVKAGSTLKIEEHIKYLTSDANSMRYKAFYVKDNETLEPMSKNTLITRSEVLPLDETVSDDTYKHVVIVGVDGMGTFSRNHSEANERIEGLFDGGAVTYDMKVSVPTVSSHSWASCLTGVTPDLHGLNVNSKVETIARDTESDYPTILKIAADEYAKQGIDADVASIAVWGGINTGIVETTDGIYKYKSNDADVGTEAIRYITEDVSSDTPTLMYVHFNCPDAYGHSKGYGTDSHLNEINYVSKMIVKINDALNSKGMLDDTLFIVTSDHGGTTVFRDDGTTYGEHGGLTDSEKYAIFAAKGKTVVPNGTIDNIEIRDTAAIALYALGLDIPSYMSAVVPANLFEGVPVTERVIYYDENNPRYHVPVSTPEKGSAGYVTNYITDKSLISYLPLDTDAKAQVGTDASENGTVEYVPGYFGNGACLNEGYLSLDDFAPGEKSFTVSLWVKSAMAYKDAPILTNKNWETKSDKGYTFYLSRGGDGPHYFGVNLADGTNVLNNNTLALPTDYDRGWMHVMLIVDREAGIVSVCSDFGTPTVYQIPESMASVSLTSDNGKLCIGDDIGGDYTFKMGLCVDEFMIFNGALDSEDIVALKNYYDY